MKNRRLYLIWLYLFILCAALGFIPEPNPLVQALLALLGLGFFAPGALLLYGAVKTRRRRHLKTVLWLSILSLGLTTVLFIANTLTVLAPENLLLGNILNAALLVFSAPMGIMPLQFFSLFGWACLMVTALTYYRRCKP